MNRAEPRFAALLLIFTSLWCLIAHADTAAVQTNVDQARHSTDDAGVPHLTISGVGKVDHPAWTALYALAYAGVEDYDPGLGLKADPQRFEASIAWLKANLAQNERGLWVWTYNFDSTYNDVSIKAPWSSAFAQATGIQALLAHWRKTQDPSSLELARKAAESLFVPLSEGGFLFSAGDDIWFEEIPSPVENPSHILNGHMRALLALNELREATGADLYQKWFGKGSDTLLRWLPLYDAGYWLRYDLNPRKDELLFRLANPYGFANPELAIDRIVLRDPESGEESVLDVGGANDAEGPLRIAGNDWGQIEEVGGRSVRRLRPVESGREAPDSEGQMVAPFSYIYLKLPGAWKNNLRKTPYELSIEYLDEKPGNLEVQMRSISPANETFKKLKDSDLLISGANVWRQWKINVNPNDLGYWVGRLYAQKHTTYLKLLAHSDNRLSSWADMATGYQNTLEPGKAFQKVSPKKIELPQQTPMLPIYSLDKSGVLMQHAATAKSRFDSNGLYDPSSDRGTPMYSPYIIATQLLDGPDTAGGVYSEIKNSDIQRAPALNWLKNPKNQVKLGDAVTFEFPFPNVYNDVTTSPPWPSAFSQAYILKALEYTLDNIDKSADIRSLLKKSAYAYEIPVSKGGISSVTRSGLVHFEEVPNATHVLNAHLASLPALASTADRLNDARIRSLKETGIETLRAKLSQFDTGYWLRYDLNPKKELLFQLDWLAGETSPLIESIALEAPQFAKQTQLYVGSEQAFDGTSRISGLEWSPVQQVDGKQARSFANGYLSHKEAVQGGTRHNAYTLMQLPEATFSDYFDVQPQRLVIRYKDVSAGQFVVKVQSISEGNALDFTPLRNSVITTTGDQQWKEAVIEVRPQDMGWFKGADYQIFEVEQLEQIAKLTGDWFFEQYTERQRYYLDSKKTGKAVIIEPVFQPVLTAVKLELVEASNMYEGFGFENALDGDPNDDYVAGLENSAQDFVTLKVGSPIKKGVLKLVWENETNHARAVSISALRAPGETYEKIAEASLPSEKEVEIPFETDKPFKNLRVEFSDFVGQPRLLLRQIELEAALPPRVGTAAEATAIFERQPEGDFLGLADIRNPLRIYRQPVSLKIKALSDYLVRGLNTDHEKVLAFMGFIDQFDVGVASDTTPETTVLEHIGACGSFTNTLLALATAQGLEGRVVSMLNYPDSDGHALAEIKIGDKWQLYDPTYGVYYTLAGSDALLSFAEVKSAYEKGLEVVVHQDSQRKGAAAYTGKDIFTRANPAGVAGPDKPFVFSLLMNLKERNSLRSSEFGPSWQGANFIGAASTNQQQRWTLEGLTPGADYVFALKAKGLGGDILTSDRTFKVRATLPDDASQILVHTFDFSQGEVQSWEIPFTAKSQTQEVVVQHDYTGPLHRYINMESYEVRKR
ncbi:MULTISPECIES: D-glucuronyl C5-epimerase family protein [unclassified Pseudomonas]|uniref:D-glucuronyl C5-epimerase family protein n=1 Tax=unclassified Pseudomonas TaxID=196821 RepID=UPI00244AE694|nr:MULTISPECIES: D-glucuronyl C5-epimerase family protein [unclassified Pseudomonas]MDG9927955.1 D-glucuronyl C5-epimerase family protein [Pseudomonas sp. GD04042]MDH0481964.1 D-glucuronyl C5-epimerase family protein [Pseudomonas sp. GD04015]MDH0604141.1 D-glucuronyl C5-epimerase family protein [Pseudomonas sp. GD03869]